MKRNNSKKKHLDMDLLPMPQCSGWQHWGLAKEAATLQ